MAISDLISLETITTQISAREKSQIIEELLDLLVKIQLVTEKEKALMALLEREAKGSTGLEKGVAVPHAKCEGVEKLCMSVGIAKEGIDFEAIDGKPSYLFFLMMAPSGASGPHVQALANLAKLMQKNSFRQRLIECDTPDKVLQCIKEAESEETVE